MKQLIFYGPTGKGLPANKLGGGERGCQRTISLYEELGVEVIIVEKPNLGRGKLTFLFDYIVTPFIFVNILLKHPKVPVHIVGFYENQLYYEYAIFFISMLFGRRMVYELRNGTMARTFYQHLWIYRMLMREIITKSTVVLCQGMEFVNFIQNHWKANTIYYPNYIMSNFIHSYNEQRAN